MNLPEAVIRDFEKRTEECEEYRSNFFQYVKNHSEEEVIQRYFFYGKPFIFRDDEDKYIELKRDIATHFDIDPSDVYMVGSSKLGFSLAPQKKYRDWKEDSDIDVAIIDSDLFDKFWRELYFEPITMLPRSVNDDENYKKFLSYFFKGWLRPDLLPAIEKKEWFDFFTSLYGKYGYKVAAGIYRKKDFFKAYHLNSIRKIDSVK